MSHALGEEQRFLDCITQRLGEVGREREREPLVCCSLHHRPRASPLTLAPYPHPPEPRHPPPREGASATAGKGKKKKTGARGRGASEGQRNDVLEGLAQTQPAGRPTSHRRPNLFFFRLDSGLLCEKASNGFSLRVSVDRRGVAAKPGWPCLGLWLLFAAPWAITNRGSFVPVGLHRDGEVSVCVCLCAGQWSRWKTGFYPLGRDERLEG